MAPKLVKILIFCLTLLLLTRLFSTPILAQMRWAVTIRVYVYELVFPAPISNAPVFFDPPGITRSTDRNGFTEQAVITFAERIAVTASPVGMVPQTRYVYRAAAGPVETIYFYLREDFPRPGPGPAPGPAPAPGGPFCELPPPSPVNLCQLQGLADTNPNDTICCPPIVTRLAAVDHVPNPDYLPCGTQVGQGDPIGCTGISGYCIIQWGPQAGQQGQWCDNLNWCDNTGGCNRSCCREDRDCPGERCNISNGWCQSGVSCNFAERIEPWPYCRATGPDPCYEWRSATVSRQIGITLLHPYLDELWRLTTNVPAGFFNILRPAARPRFEDIQGKSQIRYSGSGVNISPTLGDFFYPHLGGIQRAKEEVIRTVTPQGGR